MNYLSLGYVIRKSNGKGRPIWDCRPLNQFIPYVPNLRYDSLEMMQGQLQEGDYLVSLDQKSSYFHFGMHPDVWRHFGIKWKGQRLVATVLPFGVSLACSMVTDFMEPYGGRYARTECP